MEWVVKVFHDFVGGGISGFWRLTSENLVRGDKAEIVGNLLTKRLMIFLVNCWKNKVLSPEDSNPDSRILQMTNPNSRDY